MLQNFTQNGRSQFFGRRAGSKAVDYVDIGGPSENWIPLYHLPLCKYWDVKFSDERGQAIDFPATEGEGLGDRTRPLMVYPLKHVSGKASPRNITPKTSCRDETSGALGRSIDSKTFKRQARRQASTTALEDNGLQCVSWSTFSCVLCRWNDVRAVHHWFIGFMTAWWCTRYSCTYGHSTLFY